MKKKIYITKKELHSIWLGMTFILNALESGCNSNEKLEKYYRNNYLIINKLINKINNDDIYDIK